MTTAPLETLHDDVLAAFEAVAPSWPLSSVIAVNPLSGLEDLPFEDALRRAEALFGARGLLTLEEYRTAFDQGRIERDALLAALEGWPELELDDLFDEPGDVDPERSVRTTAERWDQIFGTTFRAAAAEELADWCARWATDPAAGDLWEDWRAADPHRAERWPERADEALRAGLDALRVPAHAQREELTAHVAALAGWASHLRWRQRTSGDAVLTGFLAASVATEATVVDGRAWFFADGPRPRAAALTLDPRPLVWQQAYERTAHDRLLATIEAAPEVGSTPRPAAQLVCCIDVRSEGLRRHLERTGPYETFGYAGFFGLAAHVVPVTGRGGTDQFPVLLGADATIAGRGSVGAATAAATLDDAWHGAETELVAPLALAEAAGWAAGPVAALRTVAPGRAARIGDRLPQRRAERPADSFDRSGVPIEAQAAVVGRVLGLGIALDPARLVVLCGHAARTDNNPAESGLGCGACGGNGGGPNARIVAAMANDPAVRDELARQGREIPATTWFLGAEHDTVTDEVRLFDRGDVPASHRDDLARLEADLVRAGEAAALDRAPSLPGRPGSLTAVRRRGRDWAEPVAELGLAGNLAFVIGPRSMTQHADLGRRVFLHSYEPDADPDGEVLGGILTAPLIVGQWISAQYAFSTTDPEIFGSGSKAVHNVVGDIGVLSGPGGDLRRGLALQSVRAGSQLLHEPLRLLAVVQGRLDHIDAAIESSDLLGRLVANGWIHVVARPDAASAWSTRHHDGWVERRLLGDGADRLVAV